MQIGFIKESGALLYVREGLAASLFLAAAFTDLRSRRVPNALLAAGIGAQFLLFCMEMVALGTIEAAGNFLISLGNSLFLIILFLAASLLLKKKLGMGDVKLIGTAALFMDLERMLRILLCGFGLAAGVGVLLVTARKKSKETRLPLVPFLLGGFLLERLLRL